MYEDILALSKTFVKSADQFTETKPRGDAEYSQEIPSHILEMANKQFNIDTLKGIDDYDQSFIYVNRTLPKVGEGRGGGEGSGRISYDLGDKVLKFAHNDQGITQNGNEARLGNQSELLTDVYDMHPKGWWVVSEKVKPFTGWDDFSLYVGVPRDLLDPGMADSRVIGEKLTPEILDQLRARYDLEPDALQFLNDIINLRHKFDLISGDTFEPSHWGVSSSGEPKLYDYGFDRYTFDKKYYPDIEPSDSEEAAMREMGFGTSIPEDDAALGVMFASVVDDLEKKVINNKIKTAEEYPGDSIDWMWQLESIITQELRKYNDKLKAEIEATDLSQPIVVNVYGTNMGPNPEIRNEIRTSISDIVTNAISYFDHKMNYPQKIGTSWTVKIL